MSSNGMSCPPARVRTPTRSIESCHRDSHTNTRWTEYPSPIRFFNHPAYDRLESVVSNANERRSAANSLSRVSISRPASIETVSGLYAESPCAITSAFTNVATPNSRSNAGANVDFPAPFGPAKTMICGFVSKTSAPCLIQYATFEFLS